MSNSTRTDLTAMRIKSSGDVIVNEGLTSHKVISTISGKTFTRMWPGGIVLNKEVGTPTIMSKKMGSGLVIKTSKAKEFDTMAVRINAGGNVGIGVVPQTKLDVDGPIRTRPSTQPGCNANKEGSIYYNKNNKHFFGCDGTSWKRLDN
ncbi:hypothetical protein HOG47_08140 [archaeon]|nr:hypothetical protein [archaeon]MBT4022832.1 hypothetical protein [archaeon]